MTKWQVIIVLSALGVLIILSAMPRHYDVADSKIKLFPPREPEAPAPAPVVATLTPEPIPAEVQRTRR